MDRFYRRPALIVDTYDRLGAALARQVQHDRSGRTAYVREYQVHGGEPRWLVAALAEGGAGRDSLAQQVNVTGQELAELVNRAGDRLVAHGNSAMERWALWAARKLERLETWILGEERKR